MKMIEKPGFFYIGKEFSMKEDKLLKKPTFYEARDLTTHAVCIGMTGSGKTGLCIDILEEAALNGIPSIIIDPKGDMTNLLLAFPDLLPDDFVPWLSQGDARRKGIDLRTYAKEVAAKWENGLNDWQIGKERIKQYKESAELKIYTPGSKAGYSVSVLSSLLAPKLSWDSEEETLREKIRGTVSALLGLIDYSTDPIRSKEHILLSNIFENYWRRGEGLSLEKLISAIGNPPFKKLGVLSIETFISKVERQKLMLDLNGLIAAPSFTDWIEGEALDIGAFLKDKNGKSKISIFYVAHLSEVERIFFVSLLLEELLTWVRTQAGTNELKTILYIDEVFGYIPPYPANPPTKKPLLLLFKQARAFGTGVMVTTQNPVDIDYKVLTNAGTWFIGKLQTERDKDRLLEGLETVTSESGGVFERKYLDRVISSLKKRVFINHNVHNEKPEIFKTRWAMSYLRGPLTKEQIRKMKKVDVVKTISEEKSAKAADSIVKVQPRVFNKLRQFFLPPKFVEDFIFEKFNISNDRIKVRRNFYSPMLFGKGRVFIDKIKPPISFSETKYYMCESDISEEFFNWKEMQSKIEEGDFSTSQNMDAKFGFSIMNSRLEKKQGVEAAEKKLIAEIIRSSGIIIYYCPLLKSYSNVGETLEEFEVRCSDELEEVQNEDMTKIERKYAKKIERIKDKINRKKVDRDRYKDESSARKREEYLSGAETALSWVFGRRSMRGFSTASRKRRMSRNSEQRAKKAETLIKDYEEDLEILKQELEEDVDEIEDRYDDAVEEIRPVEIKLKKKNVELELFCLLWIPVLEINISGEERQFNIYSGEEK